MLEIDYSRGYDRYAFTCRACSFQWFDRLGQRVWIDPLAWAVTMYRAGGWYIQTGTGAHALCPTCAQGAK